MERYYLNENDLKRFSKKLKIYEKNKDTAISKNIDEVIEITYEKKILLNFLKRIN